MEHYKNYSLENLTQVHEGVLYIEQWKPIKGYEDYYEISDFGRVKSLAREWFVGERFGKRVKGVTIAKGGLNNGYVTHRLSIDGGMKSVMAHRLVAMHFISNPESYPIINHLNSIRYDNFFKNLEWITYQGNAKHGYKYGNMKGRKGESHPLSKYTEREIRLMRQLYADGKYSQREIAKMFGDHQQNISRIVLKQRWKHIS